MTRLKDPDAAAFMTDALARLDPAVIVCTTAFAAGGNPGEPTPLDGPDVPVLQVIVASTKRAAWCESPRGLGAADLAMNVVLPELDGRILAGAISFKNPLPPDAGLAFTALINQPEPDRIAMVAERVAALVRLRANTAGRAADRDPDAGLSGRARAYRLRGRPRRAAKRGRAARRSGRLRLRGRAAPPTARALLDALSGPLADAALPLADYARLLAQLPAEIAARINAAWGEPAADPDVRDGAFRFRAQSFGNITVALPPDRGRASDRRANYHDPALPPRHALIAFGLWLQHAHRVDAIVHMGAHGTLEWLPGKAVALSASCFPQAVVGALPVFYPFIVSNPGEAAQAKRRIAGVTIGHLPPPLVDGELSGAARDLERLVDEYAQADGLDQRRRQRLAALIVETAQRNGLAGEAGIDRATGPDEALKRIDAWLCDLKDLSIKDGLHVFGRSEIRGAKSGGHCASLPPPEGGG